MAKGAIRLGAGHYHLFHLFAAIIAEHKGWFREEGQERKVPPRFFMLRVD